MHEIRPCITHTVRSIWSHRNSSTSTFYFVHFARLPMVRPAAPASSNTSPSAPAFSASSAHARTNANRNKKRLFLALLPPLLALAGLVRFSTSFFLARRSLAAKSECGAARNLLTNVLGLNSDEVDQLVEGGYVIGDDEGGTGEGCWVPRTVDAAIIVVVDALRFDFAVGRLPKSIGSRIRRSSSNNNVDEAQQSRLFTFVADPPTVTMQRLKGLTTGGLPTFADISGNFGGASIDEDSWVQQLHDVPIERRRSPLKHLHHRQGQAETGETKRVGARMAFVGDDTWVDLFPTQFDDSNPYPSFNTRDLDTVDDGCLEHLPRLLSNLGGGERLGVENDTSDEEKFELLVAHFLGVDHVGHTYGPHDRHMTEKLAQMDDALTYVLETIDSTPTDSCRAALVFGDHGMTEDGNHGGGTEDETNAALFVHYSKGCGGMGANDSSAGAGVADANAEAAVEAFESIHQIDLVPTISAMLGLPLPYANLGGLVPALLPTPRRTHHKSENVENDESDLVRVEAAAAALGLNAAQIWNYLDTYSRTANKLPSSAMLELKELLDKATEAYRTALSSSAQQQEGQGSLVAYREACSLYKLFLSEATELGKRVWTRFDTNGMILGGILLGFTLLVSFPAWSSALSVISDVRKWIIYFVSGFRAPPTVSLDVGSLIENGAAMLFMIFHCLVLTFSNSYIEAESDIIIFLLGCLCISMCIRRWANNGQEDDIRTLNNKDHGKEKLGANDHAALLPILAALCSRTNALFVFGHGLDPSIRMHAAHDASVFLPSLAILAAFRLITSHFASIHRSSYRPARKGPMASYIIQHLGVLTDVICLILLAFSWWEKRSPDHSRNGYRTCRAALLISLLGVVFSMFMPERPHQINDKGTFHRILSVLYKVLIFTVGTMGPAAAASTVLFLVQAWSLYKITAAADGKRSTPPVVASLWRLAIRHAFFATNHSPTFSRLQYSAAFVASDTFHYHMAGMSLFLNTFGWEIIGAVLVLTISSQTNRRKDVWSWFSFFQLLEAAGSCISVSLMRRHLMVWAIFAPRFVFACVFTLICLVFWMLGLILATERETNTDHRPAQSIVQSNRRSHLLSIFFALSCIISSTLAYSTLTIVDAENVRGKSNFRLRHDELVDAVGWWTETQKKNCDDSYHDFCSLVIDHGSRPSSFYHPLKSTTKDSADGIAILFSGPNEKADDVIARDVGQIASESALNGSDLKEIRVVTSDQGLRSRCRVAIDEALATRTKKKRPSGRRKGSARKRRGASSSDSISLEFIPSIAFLSQLERELARHGGSINPQETIGKEIMSEDLANELHEDIELRGKLYQVETSLREAKKSSNAGQKRLLIEKGCKISRHIYDSRDYNGETILERVLKPDANGIGDLDIEAVLSRWYKIRCDAGRAELTGDRMVQAEHLRRQLEKQVADRQSTDQGTAESRTFSPSELHYHCHKHFHGVIQPTDAPCTTSAFDKAVEKIRLVIISGPISSDVEPIPKGDVLLHTGDFTIPDNDPRIPKRKRNDKSIKEFDEWFSSNLHPIKLVLRGMNDPPAAKVELPKSKALYLNRPSTISFGGGNFLMTLVPYCTERDLSSAWRRLPHTFDTLVCRQMFHDAQMIANRIELMFSGPPQLWLTGDISRGDYDEHENLVAKSSISMRKTSIICGKEWDSEVGTDNLKPFVVDLTKQMGSNELKFDVID